ncbi:T-cell surface glycoprotein CD1a-like isoform X3 [Leopardus geoffroyi]|uniref:T-cell surface glycoprotein CD1a-like isoform X3 n=1 Tax=Leopardus geoffroyi TaxID=46844 RepID=UPI001E26071B|nr:T-cell surface glycoprotein CD1a-like isoform X3 [Leopardus geoffroyi]
MVGAKLGALGQHVSPEGTTAPCPPDFGAPPWPLLLILSPSLCPPLPQSICSSGTDFQEPITFRTIQIASFYNRAQTQNQGSAWLGQLQTHGWDSKTGAFIFLRPWSRGNFSNEKFMELEKLFYSYSIRFLQVFQDHVSQWQLEYPFQVQLEGGCELHPGEASVGFVRVAYQGSDLMSFQNTSWWPSPKGGRRTEEVCTLFNRFYVINEIIHTLLSDTCPQFLLGLLDAGKAYLKRQVRPEAWLSTGPSPGPGRLLLVCHVSGFYPKPVWVTWMRGDQEHQGTRRGEVLPHADGTWYLQTSLDVEARETAGLSCRVRHSSLGGQDIVLYWEQHRPVGLVFLVVIVPLVLLAGLAFWLWKRWKSHWRPQCTGLPSERDPSSPSSSTYLNPAQW